MANSTSLDRFSGHAALYAQYRISYPQALYEFLLSQTAGRGTAWDCGTGNGQVAADLSSYFASIEATDISAAQLQAAHLAPNITYQVCPAEQAPFPDAHFDLIVVAQALHWFDADAFHREAQRVAKPNAVIAEWGYSLVQVNAAINPLIEHFYTAVLGPYWDANRRHIDDHFTRIAFPFAQVQHQQFAVRQEWDAERFLNYLRTWSSVQKYQKQEGSDPVSQLADSLRDSWGQQKRSVTFPIFFRLGRVNK